MSMRTTGLRLAGNIGVGLVALLLAGCAYDYMQRTDRVAYGTGDAVKANLERETTNPSRDSSYLTKGLGKNGVVIPPPTTTTTPAAP